MTVTVIVTVTVTTTVTVTVIVIDTRKTMRKSGASQPGTRPLPEGETDDPSWKGPTSRGKTDDPSGKGRVPRWPFEGTFSPGIPAFPGKERGSILHLSLKKAPVSVRENEPGRV